MLSRCPGYVQSVTVQDGKGCGGNCRNEGIHLQASYGWPEITQGLLDNTVTFNGRRGIGCAVEMRYITACRLVTNSKDVWFLALEILQKRDPDGEIGEDWARKSFYKPHPEIKARWSQQLDRIRALCGSKGNYLAIKLFDNVCIQVPLAFQ